VTARASRLGRILFPDPPRHVPGQRWLNVALRTLHLLVFGALLGGHVFAVDAARLVPFLVATILTGAALMLLELAQTVHWLFMGKGVAVAAKLLLLLLVPLFWEQRVPLLLLVVVVASVAAHMPSRLRHYSLLEGRLVEPAREPAPDAARGSARRGVRAA